jgi:hypothetical protein
MSSPIAVVPLAAGAKLSLQAVLHSFISAWPRLPRPMEPQRTEQAVSFNVGGSTVSFRIVSRPITAPEFSHACSDSWLWPDAKEKLRDHRGHIVLSLDSQETRLNQVKFLSLATTALLMSTPGCRGVYWPAANLVVSPEMFQEFCVRMLPDSLPLYIWIDFRVAKNSFGKAMGYTRGMSQFGLMEMETLNAPEEMEELRERFFGLAVYLVENGLTFKNGDFIDEEAPERVRVVYGDSSFGHSKRVMRLEFETLAKSARKR